MFIFNLVLIVTVLEEAIRTKAWKGLREWDYMDMGALIVSSFKGGKDLLEKTHQDDTMGREINNNNKKKKIRSAWAASTSDGPSGVDGIYRKTYLRLDRNDALVLDEIALSKREN